MSTNRKISNEMLSAWLDDALDRDASAQLEAALIENSRLQQRLGLMMLNERRTRSAIHRMASERAVPQSLAAMLERPAKERRSTLSQKISNWLDRGAFGPGLVAASVVAALLVGFFAGDQLRSDPYGSSPILAMEPGLISVESDVHELLESTESGKIVRLREHVKGQVAFSFPLQEGGWCRQFEQHNVQAGNAIAAIACREGDQWKIELVQRIDVANAKTDHYQVASADQLEVMDAFVMQRASGEITVGEEEGRLIERGWR